jgi:hypothetical protein
VTSSLRLLLASVRAAADHTALLKHTVAHGFLGAASFTPSPSPAYAHAHAHAAGGGGAASADAAGPASLSVPPLEALLPATAVYAPVGAGCCHISQITVFSRPEPPRPPPRADPGFSVVAGLQSFFLTHVSRVSRALQGDSSPRSRPAPAPATPIPQVHAAGASTTRVKPASALAACLWLLLLLALLPLAAIYLDRAHARPLAEPSACGQGYCPAQWIASGPGQSPIDAYDGMGLRGRSGPAPGRAAVTTSSPDA